MGIELVTRAFTCIGTNHNCTVQEKNTAIPNAHQSFLNRLGEINNRTGNGIMLHNPGPINSNVEAWCVCTEVSEIESIPEGMSSFVLPLREYAHFSYTGEIYGIGEAYSKLHVWILENGDYDDGTIVEISDERFEVFRPESVVEIFIPFKRK